jgi:hypothetical protein
MEYGYVLQILNFLPSVSGVTLIYVLKCFGGLTPSSLSENGCEMCIPTGFDSLLFRKNVHTHHFDIVLNSLTLDQQKLN